MTRPDDAMERVLEGLRDVKAPGGDGAADSGSAGESCGGAWACGLEAALVGGDGSAWSGGDVWSRSRGFDCLCIGNFGGASGGCDWRSVPIRSGSGG